MTCIFDVERFLRENSGAKVLFLNNNISILEQAKKEFKHYFGEEYSYGLANSASMPKKDVDFLFGSFDKFANEFKKMDAKKFDYIIVDEAHHAQAPTYKKVVRHFEPKYLLGMTATPVRLDQKRIEELFGDPIFNLGFGEALSGGLLTPIKYSIMDDELNVDEIEKFMTSDEKITLNQLNSKFFIPKRDEEIVKTIRRKIEETNGKRTVIFCKNINHAEKIAELMSEAAVVHSSMNIEEANARIESFKHGQVPVLIAVDKLNEGVDIPEIDIVVFLRTTTSPIVLLQQMGRGLRLVPGKAYVHILDFVANYNRLVDINNLQKQIKVASSKTTKAASDKTIFSISMPSGKFRETDFDLLANFIGKTESNLGNWTKESIIARIRAITKELGRVPAAHEMCSPSSVTCAAIFGSWYNAVKAAGYESIGPKKDWLKEEIVLRILEVSKELGRAPKQEEMHDPGYMVCIKAFGNWKTALETAGLKPIRTRRQYSKQELVERLIIMRDQLGKTPTRADVRNPGVDIYGKVFGSWGAALAEAGMEPNKRAPIRYSKDDLALKLREFAENNGRIPSREEIHNPSCGRYIKEFGSWTKALVYAGLITRRRNKKYTKEDATSRVKELYLKLGRVPTVAEMNNPSIAICKKLFGSWKNCVVAAGLKPNKPGTAVACNT